MVYLTIYSFFPDISHQFIHAVKIIDTLTCSIFSSREYQSGLMPVALCSLYKFLARLRGSQIRVLKPCPLLVVFLLGVPVAGNLSVFVLIVLFYPSDPIRLVVAGICPQMGITMSRPCNAEEVAYLTR